jgi:hypothetical protein
MRSAAATRIFPRGAPRARSAPTTVGGLGAGEAEVARADEDDAIRGVHARGLDAVDHLARGAGRQEAAGVPTHSKPGHDVVSVVMFLREELEAAVGIGGSAGCRWRSARRRRRR